MKLGIVGSRRRSAFRDKQLIQKRIDELSPDMLVSGGCKEGADHFAEELARQMEIPITIYYPKTGYAKHRGELVQAYYDRNEKVAANCDYLIALVADDRRGGTENTIKHFIRIHGDTNLEIL